MPRRTCAGTARASRAADGQMSATPARRCAHAVLARVLHDGAFADRAFRSEALRFELDPRERAFSQHIAYGTVQRLRTIDWVIEQLVNRPVGAIDAPVRDALRTGIFQVVWLDGVPPHAAVDQTVELAAAESPRARGFANAVMRRATRDAAGLVASLHEDDPEDAALKYSHPDWIAAVWWQLLGAAEARALMARDNEPPESAARANRLRAARDLAIEVLRAEGAEARPDAGSDEGIVIDRAFDIHGSDAFARGLVMPQSRGSMLVSRVCAPRPGERVLDMCAAPGGKTTHLAALMEGRGQVVAIERDAARADDLRATCARLGAGIVEVRTADAREVVEPNGFDRVLIDAPCSDLGTLQSRPDARWRKNPQMITGLVELQAELLEAAGRQLRPGGILVYSTCTISPSENGQQVDRLLARHPDLVGDDFGARWRRVALAGRPGQIQLLPHRDGTDGFFIARLRRSA